jgi:D-sedoheptulose 7-phosphate isomerase
VTEHLPVGQAHIAALHGALSALERDLDRIEGWGRAIGRVLLDGGRLLAAGNGGSAAQAQHLTSELVGRYRDERQPLSALCLSAETSSVTAIANDYGIDQVFARQVAAHGRPGDVLVALSTSGRSANVLAAVTVAHERGLSVLGLTGPAPNPLSDAADDAVSVDAATTATIQEVHQVVVHLVCEAVDVEASTSAGSIDSGVVP